MAAKATRAVALFRGINVGGNHMLPMKELSAIFTQCGCADVSTFIQSGNVLYTSADPEAVVAPVSAAIAKRFGFSVPIVVRTAKEMAALAGDNPFAAAGVDAKLLYVALLQSRPTAKAVASLDPGRSPSDAFVVRGRDIYLHFAGNVARTKLNNAYFDGRLATVSTMRNWNTVQKLATLLG